MLAPAPRDPAAERLTEAARYHDYRYASNPIAAGTLPAIPGARFAAALHEHRRELPRHHRRDQRDVLGHQLLLQRAGVRGDDDPPPRRFLFAAAG